MRLNRLLIAMLAVAGALAWTAGPARADTINSRPKFDATELSELKDAFDGITSDGDYDIDIVDDQEQAAIYHPVSSFAAHAKMVSEIAVMPDGAEFGLYKFGSPGTKLKLFDDTSDATKAVSLEWDDEDGDGDVLDLIAYGRGFTETSIEDFGRRFGFYYTFGGSQGATTAVIPSTTWYSEDSLNNNLAHMLIYGSNADEKVNIDGKMESGSKVYGFDAGHYYVAVEQGGVGDNDNPNFTDFVAQFESITPSPEPTSLVMLGLGTVALAAARRRRKS